MNKSVRININASLKAVNGMGKKNVSLKTIARECGVSINTVSHALRDMNDISPKTKSRIRTKAIELGYMPNHISMDIRVNENPSVGFLINSFDNLYYNLICKELAALFKKNKEFEFSLLYSCNETYLTEKDIKYCILQRIDLIISHLPPSTDAIELATLNNINIITIGSINESVICDNVSIDNQMGCILAARYLSNFHTNNKYIYVGIDYFLSEKRFEMFKSELVQAGYDDVLHFNSSRDDIMTLYSYIQQGYRSIFFYNDVTAYKTLHLLDELAIDIRRLYPDLHMIGFDGLCASVYGLREISSIRMDFKEYANQTYLLIKKRLENAKEPPKSIVLPVYIYQRKKKE